MQHRLILSRILNAGKYYAGLLVLFFLGVLLSPHDAQGNNIFLSADNLSDVFRQVSNIGVISVGMCLVIIAGGIDLSVGSIMGLGSVLTAMLLTQSGWNGASGFALAAGSISVFALVWLVLGWLRLSPTGLAFRARSDTTGHMVRIAGAAAAALLFAMAMAWRTPNKFPLWLVLIAVPLSGCALGLLNGLIITRGKMQAFIVTLASMVGVMGAARLISGQDTAVHAIYSGVNATHEIEALRAVLGDWLPVPALFFLGTALIVGAVLSRTVFGTYLYAIGGNERCARLCGLNTDHCKIATYALSGLLAALVGVLFAAQFRQGKADAGLGWELDAVAAVVIGGTPLSGGSGRMLGTVAGVFIFGILGNILLLNNVDSNTQLLLKGIIIVLAVFLQQSLRSRTDISA